MGVLNSLADAAVNAGKKMVAPDDDSASGLSAKRANIDEYTRATRPAKPASDPVVFAPTSPMDKINPRAKFGDRPGEKRLPVYHKGTPAVPKTGPAILEKGEAVIPAKDNPMNPYDKITEGAKKPKKVLHEIRTRKAKSGGYIHEHHHTEPMHHKMEEHTTPDKDAMAAHMMEHMGSDAAPEQQESAAGAQDAAIGA